MDALIVYIEIAKRTLIEKGEYTVVGGLISPVSASYGKPGLLPSDVRLQLCRLGCKHSDWIDVDDWEAGQSSWQRTAVTLEQLHTRLRSFFPKQTIHIHFLMSYDCLSTMNDPTIWDPSFVCLTVLVQTIDYPFSSLDFFSLI